MKLLNLPLLLIFLCFSSTLMATWPAAKNSIPSEFSVSESRTFNNRAENYEYPFRDPYFATLTGLIFSLNEIDPIKIAIPPLPGRMEVPLLEKRAKEFRVSAYIQPQPAPVIFLIPGFGSGAEGGRLAKELFSMGYSVLSPPSPSNWLFVLAQSRHGLTGYLPEDVKDLNRVLLQAVKIARAKYKLRPTSYRILGTSMGAAHAAHLWLLDQARPQFKFQKIVMINPPLNMSYSMRTLDQLYSIGEAWPESQRNNLWGKAILHAEEIFGKIQKGEDVMSNLVELFPLKTAEIQYLIGDSFRRSLRDSTFVVDQIHNTGYFKTPVSKFKRDARLAEIKAVGFSEFMQRIAYPIWARRLNKPHDWRVQDFFNELNVEDSLSKMRLDPKVYFMSNSDDFVTKDSASYAAAAAFGPNGYLYPYGGHCGNLWYGTNSDDLRQILK